MSHEKIYSIKNLLQEKVYPVENLLHEKIYPVENLLHKKNYPVKILPTEKMFHTPQQRQVFASKIQSILFTFTKRKNFC